jgi:hypothetical protein
LVSDFYRGDSGEIYGGGRGEWHPFASELLKLLFTTLWEVRKTARHCDNSIGQCQVTVVRCAAKK